MIAAIYARKSTEQNGVADEVRSVARQVEHAKAYAAKKGWAIAEPHVYVDDGISGAEFARRPGLMRLMNSLKPKPTFQVLIMSEESRLGRESIEVGYIIKQLVSANVRLFFYLEDRERTLDSPLEKVMLSLANFADEVEREKASTRTYDAMISKARKGHICGGSCYGYRNREVLKADGERSHVTREIHDGEAAVIRRIFTLYVSGQGFTTIAKTLNAEHAPGPLVRKSVGWGASAVRAILYRDLYNGRLVWGVTKKKDRWGARKVSKCAEQNWITTAVPHLQIIDDALWREAHARLKNVRALYLRATDGRVYGKPAAGYESRYLLCGFTTCAHCGSSVYVRSHANGRQARKCYYSCSGFYLRGHEVCIERLRLPIEEADRAILATIERDVLNPAVVAKAIEKAVDQLQSDRKDPELRRDVLTKELHGLETELARFTQAIAAGGSVPTIVSAIQEREARRVKVQAELALLDGKPVEQFSASQIEQELTTYLKDWTGLAARHPLQTRQVLRKLLPSRIKLSREADGTFRFSGTAALGRVLTGLVGFHRGRGQGKNHGAPDRT